MKEKKRSFDYSEAYESSLEYFGGDELAANVFVTKYALTNKDGRILEKNPDDMHQRLATEFARIESKYKNPMSYDEIYSLLKDFKYVIPQGSPMSGIGNPHQIQSISNCFVVESPHDSYGGILKSDQELVQIAKRRGGVGFDLSTIRPRGRTTANCARTTDGIEVFMDRFSNSCREVAQNGRRGALMLTISVHHPQIRDFIRIKRDLKRVTGANISVRLSDEFMNAVESSSEFELRWPVDSTSPKVSEQTDAKDLWHEIIESAHASAEPGLLFWDTAKRLTPTDIYESEGFGSTSTNPCGEIILSPYDSCRLMVVNLLSFVKNPFTSKAEFDYSKMSETVQKAQRLMDDMIDLEIEQIGKILEKIESDPEPIEVKKIEMQLWKNIENMALTGRRTGLGVTAVGDTVAALGVRYGSPESIDLVEKLYKSLTVNAYRSSCILAKERGAFQVHDHNKERGHEFLERIWEEAPDVYKMSKETGRRNIAITTTAPAGSVSVMTQTTSGIEPAFLLHYTRRKKLTENDLEARVDFIDDSGDRWQEYTVYHKPFKRWMDENDSGLTDSSDSPYAGACSNDIDWVSKVKVQAAAQKWICHAISNTTNLPKDTGIDVVKDVYMTGWKSGCKGVTIYRDGSRDGVLLSSDSGGSSSDDREKTSVQTTTAPKRPDSLECDIHQVNIKGEAWTVLIGLMDGSPYEVLGGLSEYVEIPRKYQSGTIRRRPRKSVASKYDLIFGEEGNEITVKDIVKVFDNPNHAGFTRTLSLALRHGVPINYLVEQLQKDKDADLFSFSRVVGRCLKKYIPDGTKASSGVIQGCCESPNVVYQEGCATCLSCGTSKCS